MATADNYFSANTELWSGHLRATPFKDYRRLGGEQVFTARMLPLIVYKDLK